MSTSQRNKIKSQIEKELAFADGKVSKEKHSRRLRNLSNYINSMSSNRDKSDAKSVASHIIQQRIDQGSDSNSDNGQALR